VHFSGCRHDLPGIAAFEQADVDQGATPELGQVFERGDAIGQYPQGAGTFMEIHRVCRDAANAYHERTDRAPRCDHGAARPRGLEHQDRIRAARLVFYPGARASRPQFLIRHQNMSNFFQAIEAGSHQGAHRLARHH